MRNYEIIFAEVVSKRKVTFMEIRLYLVSNNKQHLY